MERPCIAFKMNYCDGGKNENRVGFFGICSDVVIRYNIVTVKHRWCLDDDCPCKKLFARKISRSELETFWSPDKPDCHPCYESVLLRDWTVNAGNNPNGTLRKFRGGEKNHLCALTTKLPHMPEDTRFVFALFIMREIFKGDAKSAASVTADDYWRLEFRPNEAVQMKFWNVYKNPNAPQRIQWDSGFLRYIDDATAVKFLEMAVEIKHGTPEENFAKEFLKQYPYA